MSSDREIRTILVVDGSTTMLFYLGSLLQRLEYRVATARGYEQAMRHLQEHTPSLIVTDISLPGGNGIHFLKEIKDTPSLKELPVVVLTFDSDPGTKDTCLRLGCAAYLTKPVEPEVLYRTLQTASETIPRLNIRLNTSLKVLVGDGSVLGGAQRTEYATALSEGGLYIRTLYPQPRNTVTPVTIYLQDRAIKAKAIVLYSYTVGEGTFRDPGMGMKFVEIGADDKQFIGAFIRDQLIGDIAPEGGDAASASMNP